MATAHSSECWTHLCTSSCTPTIYWLLLDLTCRSTCGGRSTSPDCKWYVFIIYLWLGDLPDVWPPAQNDFSPLPNFTPGTFPQHISSSSMGIVVLLSFVFQIFGIFQGRILKLLGLAPPSNYHSVFSLNWSLSLRREHWDCHFTPSLKDYLLFLSRACPSQPTPDNDNCFFALLYLPIHQRLDTQTSPVTIRPTPVPQFIPPFPLLPWISQQPPNLLSFSQAFTTVIR